MKISQFFLGRPVFACVLSILIVLGGFVALRALPVEQYPNLVPPQVQLTVNYPGANAQVIADTVAAPLETQINGVENMIYMYSESSDSGQLTLNVFFKIGTDINQALNDVQDRVDMALSQLPEETQREGVIVKKETTGILMLIAIEDEGNRYDELYLNNYATITIAQALQRQYGVSDAEVINARNYAMRIWLRPDKMAELGIDVQDITKAIQNQNYDYPLGELGMPPTLTTTPLTLPVTSTGRLSTPEEYEAIILRANPDGATVTIGDVGRAELGAQSYAVIGKMNGKSIPLILVHQEYGANALDVSKAVKKEMEKLSKRFPAGITYSVPYDITEYIHVSIEEVKRTLYIAACLVALVMFIFLQSLRATIIPVIAMVVSLIGTFIGMYVLGFSINTLTLFGLVLAIGIVVDDAIVVVENVERNIRVHNLSPKEAALRAMAEVSGPIIAIVFVLCAVFLPVAFIGGVAGQLYKQFAITISLSVVISGMVALTLSPVLASYFLKNRRHRGKFAQSFNRSFEKCADGYSRGAGWLLRHAVIGWVAFACVIGGIVFLFYITPRSFVPKEDQGYLFAMGVLPDGASLQRSEELADLVEPIALENPAVKSIVTMTGYSLVENISRATVGTYFVNLKNWNRRRKKSLHASAVLKELEEEYFEIPEGEVMIFNPPAIPGLGSVGGFEFWIINEGEGGDEALTRVTESFLEAAKKRPEIEKIVSSLNTNSLRLFADLDRVKARALDVPIGAIYQTLQSLLGSVYVNDFNKYGQVFQVLVQAEPSYRSSLKEIGNIYVRSNSGNMVPLKSLVSFRYTKGTSLVSRFNNFVSVRFNGGNAPGYSSGQALKAVEEVANEVLPLSMSFSWSGLAYEAKASGGASGIVLIAALLLVFLILAALYERWSLPIAILLGVPFGILGALIAILIRGINNDVYFQIGLVTLIALAAKNAILIVEFALQSRREGKSAQKAALEGARIRFRAILMTSLTFIFGVSPLVFSRGAGAASRHSVGTGVMGGMLFATAFGIFFIPLFYALIDRRKSNENQNQ